MTRRRAGDGQTGAERGGPGVATARATAGSDGGRRAPRGVHPEPWRLSETLLAARSRLPYATAEARLLDGLQRWLALECRVPVGGVSLAPSGPRWAHVLAAVTAVARLCSDDTQRLLAPWVTPGPAAPVAGVSPHAGVAFEPYSLPALVCAWCSASDGHRPGCPRVDGDPPKP